MRHATHVLLAVAFGMMNSCSSPGSSPVERNSTNTSRSTSSATGAVSPATPKVCSSDQIAIVPAVIAGGGGGQLSASYWVRNTSLTPCRLARTTTVELLDRSGEVIETIPAAPEQGDLYLPTQAVPPSDPPPPGTVASFRVLFSPGDPHSGGGPCPDPLMTPDAIRI